MILKPLPELDGTAFTHSVMVRTKRIAVWRSITRLVAYFCGTAVFVAAVPWQSITTRLDVMFKVVNQTAEPVWSIGAWTEWLQSLTYLQDIQTQQLVLTAALISVICGAISFVVAEA